MSPLSAQIKYRVLQYLNDAIRDNLLKFKGKIYDKACQEQIKKAVALAIQDSAAHFAFDPVIQKEIRETIIEIKVPETAPKNSSAPIKFGPYTLEVKGSSLLG
jgi:hypothetical protein